MKFGFIKLPTAWVAALKRNATPSVKITGCSYIGAVSLNISLELDALCGPLEATVQISPAIAEQLQDQLTRAIESAKEVYAA